MSHLHSRFRQFGLALDVPISYIDVGSPKFELQMLKPSHFYQHLADLGKLNILYGKEDPSILQEFWYRFSQVEPANTILESFESGALDPCHTIPLLLHGDEGRGKKHSPCMIINTHGWIGLGSRPFEEWHKDTPALKKKVMGVNIAGSSAATRFLVFVVPKKAYGPGQIYLEKMMTVLVEDLVRLQTVGVFVGQQRWCLATVGATGDLQWFCKAGKLVRSYNHVSKKSGQKTKIGICHLCLAREANYNFESFVDSPAWESSVGLVDPWHETPELIRRLHINIRNPASFFKPDIWHCLHLGVGKVFLASAMVEWLPHLPGTFSPNTCKFFFWGGGGGCFWFLENCSM